MDADGCGDPKLEKAFAGKGQGGADDIRKADLGEKSHRLAFRVQRRDGAFWQVRNAAQLRSDRGEGSVAARKSHPGAGEARGFEERLNRGIGHGDLPGE